MLLIIAAFLAAIQPSGEAGILDLLRGDPTEVTVQRVAFVGHAEVKSVSGSVERLVGVDRWKTLRAGTELSPGDVIRTGEGTAVLRMRESLSYVKVTPNTVLRMADSHTGWDHATVSGQEEREGFIVRSCRGKAFHNAGGIWQPLRVNAVLAHGTDIRTEAGALVDLYETETKRPVRVPGASRITLDERMLAGGILVRPSLAAAIR